MSESDATTERISSEALRLFVERGYGTTTIEHISNAAEVGVATIYRRWPDKAAIANELYARGLDATVQFLDPPPADDPRTAFIALWRQVWAWATANRDLFLFVNVSAGASWLTEENVQRKAQFADAEFDGFSQLGIDAAPDFAAGLLIATITSLLTIEPHIEPDEVGQRLWRALCLDGA